MKSTAIIGVIVLILGVAALVYQGITYTKKDTVLDLGPIHAEAARQHTIPVPPIIGITAVIGGIALIVVGSKK